MGRWVGVGFGAWGLEEGNHIRSIYRLHDSNLATKSLFFLRVFFPAPLAAASQVWTAAATADAAWHAFLGRPFVGLAPTAAYAEPFDAQVLFCTTQHSIAQHTLESESESDCILSRRS